ncbi:MAG: Fic family protein [Sedimentisphaerales bacterium]|nr:Fic family protein [Sedimentisphaerales bacterium]
MKDSVWNPVYTISPAIARALMEIEAAKTAVEHTPLSPAAQAELRYRARVRSTHYSTRIEGNRLTLKEAQDVIEKRKTQFHGRQRDVGEVRNYWDALLKIEDWAAHKIEFTEDLICRIHAVVVRGKRSKPSMYRDGQNVIRDSSSGGIVYMPPEAKDVTGMMAQMVRWVKKAEQQHLPVPLVAALVHYQFVTIHPYYDGNGRTARLLATFILQRGGYGLNGYFSMEEHHAGDLARYYNALAVHGHHNYYEGRATVDLTPWLEYFMALLAGVFQQAKEEAAAMSGQARPAEPELLRQLDHRARLVLSLFGKKERITSQDVAMTLGLSVRMVRLLLNQWVQEGWLIVADTSNRGRRYELSVIYRQFVGNLSAM